MKDTYRTRARCATGRVAGKPGARPPIMGYDEAMLSMRQRELAGMPQVSTVALSYAQDSIRPFAHLAGSLAEDKNQPWICSVPTRTTSAPSGKRPGTEEWARNCDSHHINFITAGRNVH